MKPPILKCDEWYEANWDKTQANIPEKIICRVINDGLPDSLKHELDNKQVDYPLMTDAQFVDDLKNIEAKEKCGCEVRYRAQAVLKKKPSKKLDSDISHRHANNEKRKKESRHSIQGTARYFSICKNSGMPPEKFKSHHTDKCHDRKEKMKMP